MLEKKTLRSQIRQKQKALLTAEKKRAAVQATEHLSHLYEYRDAKYIGIYASEDTELSTQFVFDLSKSKNMKIHFPVVCGNALEFRQIVSWEDLGLGYRNILEPKKGCFVSLNQLDLLIVPGVSFDRKGYRLGRGGGFYDRVLSSAHKPSCSIGFAYDFQIIPRIPVESHDQRVDMVVTNLEVIRP